MWISPPFTGKGYGGVGHDSLNGGDGHDRIYGGMHKDTQSGGDENDRLYGDAGLNTLSGGWRRDTFIFNMALDRKRNVTATTDFNVADDTIRLENAAFGKPAKTGALNKAYFVVGSKALDENDYLIDNRKTGYLSDDPDGSGHSAAILFAKLKPGLALTSSDFFVI